MKTICNTVISLVFGSLVIASCIHSDVVSVSESGAVIQDKEYMVFGTFYGFFRENTSDAIDTYKLTHHALYIDTTSNRDVNKAQFMRLSNDKFNLVKDLINAIPPDLIVLNDSTFGCPNCADQGGINIIYYSGGVKKQWVIDQYNQYNPAFLHDFRNDINEKIQLLNP